MVYRAYGVGYGDFVVVLVVKDGGLEGFRF